MCDSFEILSWARDVGSLAFSGVVSGIHCNTSYGLVCCFAVGLSVVSSCLLLLCYSCTQPKYPIEEFIISTHKIIEAIAEPPCS